VFLSQLCLNAGGSIEVRSVILCGHGRRLSNWQVQAARQASAGIWSFCSARITTVDSCGGVSLVSIGLSIDGSEVANKIRTAEEFFTAWHDSQVGYQTSVLIGARQPGQDLSVEINPHTVRICRVTCKQNNREGLNNRRSYSCTE
jgi:hypothetical protein